MKATSSGQRVRKVCSDHDLMLERLRSLDNCLEDIFYHGEVCSDLRGFGGLRQRCQELHKTLQQHIPEGEKVFLEVKEDSQVCPLLGELVEDHREMLRALEQTLQSLEALESGAMLPEDLFTLQERVRAFSAKLQRHIHTVNQQVLPRVDAT